MDKGKEGEGREGGREGEWEGDVRKEGGNDGGWEGDGRIDII